MTQLDPNTCRRALRDIGEIAAVAMLDGSQMSGQEALQIIAAIDEWVDEDPLERADCSDRIHGLHAMTATTDFEPLSDGEATRLFSEVRQVLRS
ncbi:hypothetical protein [Brevundimonas sp.]|uniref:hypothetical protein n=1 Tax=Brevundimonas sp. TaxID=1871086 RepID=UPI0028A12DA1|nr:hypothetical protein [Brevundimonas sp.]